LADLTFDAEGNLYGTTQYGGGFCPTYGGCGTAFELKRSGNSWTEQILHSFNGDDDAFPYSDVIFDRAGNLYGTTSGDHDRGKCGHVYELSPDHGNWKETVLKTFTCAQGEGFSQSGLAFDAKGNLFGITSTAAFVLHLRPDGKWKEETIHEFSNPPEGLVPSAFFLSPNGDVYGTTAAGGNGQCFYSQTISGCGVAFRLNREDNGTWRETVLYNFARGGGFGNLPAAGWFLENPNHAIGTTLLGGNGVGAVFELSLTDNSWKQNVLNRFYEEDDGEFPSGKLLRTPTGIFGVTPRGGVNGMGIVYELGHTSVADWKERVIYAFSGGAGDGQTPYGGLVIDSQGNLYGTTWSGGPGNCYNGCGTVYEITPAETP